jgi:glyoxylase-like metal-dependent hydrolase (beta-lactamase superfamily II)
MPDPRARVVLAPNPGPLTLEGTNTYVLCRPGGRGAVVVDPGPDDPAHLAAIAQEAANGGQRIELILLTHGHEDHSAGAPALARRTGVPVRALDPAHRLGSEGLGDGDVVTVDGLEIQVVATPGHSGDSLCFLLPAAGDGAAAGSSRAVLTGDTVLGRGTSVVAHPDGRLRDYLDTLCRLRDLGDTLVLPGHGPELPSAGQIAQQYLQHRQARLEQVRAALRAGAGAGAGVGVGTGAGGGQREPVGDIVESVVATVYADVDRSLWPAAALSVRAQLDYLAERPAR